MPKEKIIAGAGADEILNLLFQVVMPEKVVACPPTFGMYKFFSLLYRCEFVEVRGPVTRLPPTPSRATH